ncbi:hypothetical protein [Clostridium ganghwense]|uniref:Type II secretion system protein n=1 Tax=Clostridium ganghwense TaxID=312089 RepID=A0ABT4CMP7_9CLOT|nr:hypothetical protein [Clostridium ganghwense]MCY6370330.1 hypothetical protein [Clostridium ganghwense]
MIFTLLILSIILTSLLCSFSIQILRRKNNLDFIYYNLGQDIYEKHKEYLLSRINKYIKENSSVNINNESVHNLLSNINDREISFKNSYVMYDKEKRNIILYIYPPDGKTYRREYYIYKIREDNQKKIEFSYLKTEC